MKTATVQVQGNQLGVLWQIVNRFQPKSMAEQRGHTRVMHDFGLDLIEAKLLNDPATPVDMPKEAQACEITEAGYLYLCSQFEHLDVLFPAGKNEAGVELRAGLPTLWSRILAPLFMKLDEEFKLGDFKPEVKPEAKE